MKSPRRILTLVLAFLALGGACGRPTPSSVPLGGEDDPPPPEEPVRSVSEGPAQPSEAADESEPPEEEEETDGDSDDEEPVEGSGGAPPDDDDEESEPQEQAAPVSKAPACDDSKPSTVNCSEANRTCPPVIAPMCSVLERVVKPRVGQALVDCMVGQGCRFEAGEQCAKSAIRKACVDDAARAFCEDRYEACTDEFQEANATQQDCEYAISSLQKEVRSRFTACLANTCDLESCLMRIAPSLR